MRKPRFEVSAEPSATRSRWARVIEVASVVLLFGLLGMTLLPIQIWADDWVQPSISQIAPVPESIDQLPPLVGTTGKFAPEALTMDELGRLFVLDRSRDVILRSADEGWVTFSAGAQGGRRLAILIGLAALGPDLFALDPVELTLYRFDLLGRLKSPISLWPSLVSQGIETIDAVDFDMTKSGELLLLDRAGRRLLLFDRFGVFLTDLTEGTTGARRFRSPLTLTQDGAGEIYVLDPPDRTVRRFSRQGEARTPWRYDEGLPKGASRGRHITATRWGQVIVASSDGSWLRVFQSDGVLLHHEEFSDRKGFSVSDLIAGPDSVLYLAQPERGNVGRLGLRYPSVISVPHR